MGQTGVSWDGTLLNYPQQRSNVSGENPQFHGTSFLFSWSPSSSHWECGSARALMISAKVLLKYSSGFIWKWRAQNIKAWLLSSVHWVELLYNKLTRCCSSRMMMNYFLLSPYTSNRLQQASFVHDRWGRISKAYSANSAFFVWTQMYTALLEVEFFTFLSLFDSPNCNISTHICHFYPANLAIITLILVHLLQPNWWEKACVCHCA